MRCVIRVLLTYLAAALKYLDEIWKNEGINAWAPAVRGGGGALAVPWKC